MWEEMQAVLDLLRIFIHVTVVYQVVALLCPICRKTLLRQVPACPVEKRLHQNI